ncbi:unnamed protein product [Malus baccata var. baccata]
MCILCVIQKWSRRVATMLPWLVIPLIGLWGLSQLLPPAFRFEITSPRLACVLVLLVTLFWYEVLMPQLSAWRVRRNAMLRERKRFEAIELQKLRKTATRRCRNCSTPYRDQNPGGGRFMCSYCGHLSKRPVLDLPEVPGMGLSKSGIIKDLVGKGGKILNGKAWSENGWMQGQDWSENGNWVNGSVGGKSSYWRKDGSSVFGADESCLAEKSYSGVVNFACKLLTFFFLSVRWLWRKLFSSSTSDDASDGDRKGLAKRGENGANLNESRGEKARRKAEEKRQAKIEKELLEEEERKQREEVARLVEERRRLRDEKKEAERGKSSPPVIEKDTKKEAEKKRQERRKEKDKGSSKSNSDAEELEKRAGKESERKRDLDKKSDIDRREHLKSGADFLKGQSMEMGHNIKNASANNFIQGNAGSRYLDRMRGTIFNSSKAFGGGSFFGKDANTTMTKETKSSSSVDHFHSYYAQKRDLCPPERVAARPFINGDDKSVLRPVHSEPQSGTAPKKSWQQLFTRSSSVPSSSSVNVISRPNAKSQTKVQSPQLSGQSSSIQSFDNPINFGLPSPFALSTTYPKGSTSSSLGFSPAIDPIFPRIGEGHHELIPEEPELFEDPSYVPDPVSLLGPVSESLDNFQLNMGLERPRTLKNGPASSEVNKPSPIESPMSREKLNNSSRFPSTPKAHDMHAYPLDDASANDKGTWQMWNSCPLGQEGLGFAGGSPSWFLPPELKRSNKDDLLHPSSVSLFTTEDQVVSGSQSPKNQRIFLGNGQNGGTFSPVTGSGDHDPWLQKAFFPPLSTAENHFHLRPPDETSKNELIFGSPIRATGNHPFELPQANGWSDRKEWDECAVTGTGDGVGKPYVLRPPVRGMYPTPNPNVQPLW